MQQTIAKLIDSVLNKISEIIDGFLREVRIQRYPPTTMEFMLHGRQNRIRDSKSMPPSRQLVILCARGVGDLEEVGIRDVNLFWIDPNDGT